MEGDDGSIGNWEFGIGIEKFVFPQLISLSIIIGTVACPNIYIVVVGLGLA